MSRWRRRLPDGVIQHVVNRGSKRGLIFHQAVDCVDFLELLADAGERHPVRLVGFSLMKNHFHLLLRPEKGQALSAYMQWLMNAHIRQYRRRYGGAGEGHIYQGRYRNSSVSTLQDFFRVLRYIEANARRARFVSRAEDWPWCSLATAESPSGRPLLDESAPRRPRNWLDLVNSDMDELELRRIREASATGSPLQGLLVR